MREGLRPRPAYQAHKWFARRFAVTARSLLTAAVSTSKSNFRKAYYGNATCKNIAVLDPFMGGGVMLLEAARLGASIYGMDVEPVATAVSDFQGRLWDLPDLSAAMAQLRTSVGVKLARFYRCEDADGKEETLLHAFWVQTVECGKCSCVFDAHPSFRLSWDEKSGRQWSACRHCSAIVEGDVSGTSLACDCGNLTNPMEGHGAKGVATCPSCLHDERLIEVARRCGKPAYRLFGVETIPSGPERRYTNRVRRIRTATDADRASFHEASAELERLLAEGSVSIPICAIPREGRSDNRLIDYGHRDYSDLFNARQKLHLALLAAEIVKMDEPFREAMTIAFSDHLTTNNNLCGYAGGWRRLSPLFAIRAYRHISRPVEVNPWLEHNGRGTFPNAVRAISKAAESMAKPTEPTVEGLTVGVPLMRPKAWDVRCGDARSMAHLADGSIDLVLTDPPYFDYISYSELGHFYVPWLVWFGMIGKEHLSGFPDGQLASSGRSQAQSDLFGKNLAQAMKEVARVCNPEGRVVFTYQNLEGKGWAALGFAMAEAGLMPIKAFPMYGDGATSLHKHENSISWDCVLVCKRMKAVLKIDLTGVAKGGEVFSEAWAAKLTNAGHVLSTGDVKNLHHAGALLSAFDQAAEASQDAMAS
jgi:SAM-dependent methyltransferase